MHVSFQQLDKELSPPVRAHAGDAGLDLRSAESFELAQGERRAVPTGLAVAIPEGHAGLVVPRSGLAARHGIGIVNAPGIVDAGYRGEIKVLLINHGSEPVAFSRDERIAQLVITPVVVADVELVDDLDDTERGAGGFGSSGR